MEFLLFILASHFSRYPAIQVQDVYKLLYQAALGSEHAITDEESARECLEEEMLGMGTGPEEPLIDPISPGGRIVRVHLRPYIRVGKEPRLLLNAFSRTAKNWAGSKNTLGDYMKATTQLADSQDWSLLKVEFEAFFAKMEALDFPPAHHSSIYASLYRPAYRVVARKYLEVI